jgi:hypothetical protein
MANLTLEDGRIITVDLTKISLREYRALFDKNQKPEEEDKVLCRVFDMTLEEYQTLPYPTWRKLTELFFEQARSPLADPNSPSESISA